MKKQYVEVAAGRLNGMCCFATSECDVEVPERAINEDVSILGTTNDFDRF